MYQDPGLPCGVTNAMIDDSGTSKLICCGCDATKDWLIDHGDDLRQCRHCDKWVCGDCLKDEGCCPNCLAEFNDDQ